MTILIIGDSGCTNATLTGFDQNVISFPDHLKMFLNKEIIVCACPGIRADEMQSHLFSGNRYTKYKENPYVDNRVVDSCHFKELDTKHLKNFPHIFLNIGFNDIAHGLSTAECVKNITSLASAIRDKNSDAKITLLPIPPLYLSPDLNKESSIVLRMRMGVEEIANNLSRNRIENSQNAFRKTILAVNIGLKSWLEEKKESHRINGLDNYFNITNLIYNSEGKAWAEDGFHFSTEIYKAIAKQIAKELKPSQEISEASTFSPLEKKIHQSL